MIPLGVLAARRPAAGGSPLTYLDSGSGYTGSTITTFTISGLDLGTGDRTLVVAVGVAVSGGGSISALTVAGQAVTIDAQTDAQPAAAIGRVSLGSGTTTGDVVLTLSNGNTSAWASLYSYPGSLNLVDTAAHYKGSSASSFSAAVDTASGGFAVASTGVRSNSDGATHAWTGLGEDYDNANPAGTTSAAHVATTGAELTASVAISGGSSLRFGGMAVASYEPA